MLADAGTVLTKTITIAIMGTLGSSFHRLVAQSTWVKAQSRSQLGVAVGAVAVLLVVEGPVKRIPSIDSGGRSTVVLLRRHFCDLFGRQEWAWHVLIQDGINDGCILGGQPD